TGWTQSNRGGWMWRQICPRCLALWCTAMAAVFENCHDARAELRRACRPGGARPGLLWSHRACLGSRGALFPYVGRNRRRNELSARRVRKIQVTPAYERVMKDIVIPKLFHWIWFGPKPIPELHQRWIDGWLQLHPGWKHILWTDANRPALVNE